MYIRKTKERIISTHLCRNERTYAIIERTYKNALFPKNVIDLCYGILKIVFRNVKLCTITCRGPKKAEKDIKWGKWRKEEETDKAESKH